VIKVIKFIVHKETEDLDVLLLRHKGTDKYSFVNLTKGHICKCVFDSVDEAMKDIEDRKANGLLIDYEIVE
jgi:hypothetical protein